MSGPDIWNTTYRQLPNLGHDVLGTESRTWISGTIIAGAIVIAKARAQCRSVSRETH
jgi:hypothetical protein